MNETVIYIILAAVIAGIYFLDRYHKTDGDIIKLAAELIPEAEEVFLDREKSGTEKMTWVSEQIGMFIPSLLKCFFSEEKIKSMVQFVFDRITGFMKVK